MLKTYVKLAVVCGLIGYAVALAVGFLPPSDVPHLSFAFVACICPPALLSAASMTDPDASAVLFVLAPLNALIYAAVGTALYATAKETKREIKELRQRRARQL
jgi:hypothetical protein